MKRSFLKTAVFVLLFGLTAALLSGCEKQIVPAGEKLYPYTTLEQATQEAEVILYGVIESTDGETFVHSAAASDGTVIEEAFTPVTLRVRQVLKNNGQEIGDTYVFNAPGGETATKVFLSDYGFSESEEVVVFLNGYDVPFGPYDTYRFSDGSTEVPVDKLPASAQNALSSEAGSGASVPVSTEDFLALIESFV